MKLKMILKLKQNIGKSVYIAVVNTKQKNKIKLLNRKLVIENEVMENEIKNELKLKLKLKQYWHKCRHCSRRHSTKIKWNKMKQNKIYIKK